MSSAPSPLLGPCSAWIDGADVAACFDVDPRESGAALFETVAVEASMVLYELSGRRFPNVCEATVRPCRRVCSCWGTLAIGSIWSWSWAPTGLWINEDGRSCGCSPESKVKLAGYPVHEITEVKIDGDVLDPSDYRLDGWRYLVRLDTPGPPVVRNAWPGCQNLTLPDSEPGTFSVSYTWGTPPPPLGLQAAAQLAAELYKACPETRGDCDLPDNVVRVVRQGVEFDRQNITNFLLDSKKGTGLSLVDIFLATYARDRPRRRPALWTPDVAAYPLRVTE